MVMQDDGMGAIALYIHKAVNDWMSTIPQG
jgi:hypothetical protein